MFKILYPDGNITSEEASELVDFMAESRKRVKDQLYIIDETFRAEPASFKYLNLKNGNEVFVETLENISNGITPSAIPVSNTLDDADVIPMNKGEEPRSQLEPSDTEKQSVIASLSFKRRVCLFAWDKRELLMKSSLQHISKKANEITIEDPIFVPVAD